MTLKDLINRSQLICNVPIGQEGIVFYNEFLDNLTEKCFRNATELSDTYFNCENPKNDFYKIPKSTLFVTDVYFKNKKVDVRNSGDKLIFPHKGEYKIKYTVFPEYASAVDDTVTHSNIYDNACIYFLCYKKALQENFDESTVTFYLTNYSDYINSAYNKNRLKSKTNVIPIRPFIE